MSKDIYLPDIGDYADVDVVDVIAKEGDVLAEEDILITLETDKAAMDIPAPQAGKVAKLHIKAGDKISKGDLILTLDEVKADISKSEVSKKDEKEDKQEANLEVKNISAVNLDSESTVEALVDDTESAQESMIDGSKVYASPGVRRFASSLGVNLAKVEGTGKKDRILKIDIEKYVKGNLSSGGGYVNSGAGNVSGLNVMAMKSVDFSKFGEVSSKPLSRIKKISGATLHRNWVHIPHVTQFDEADITELETFRQQQKAIAEKKGVKLTPLVFILKAIVASLKQFPYFNSSLNSDNDAVFLKKYFHIGVAVDTPNGLVVPVIRDVDQKGLFQLAEELAVLSKQAREGKLTAEQMSGGCFTISSLGGIGGTSFTPIINSPEVAILGISRSAMKPVYDKTKASFTPRLIMPLSLSYDHRVIDGAEAVRFTSFLVKQLSDIRNLLL